MPTPRVITTPTDLLKYVKNILGAQWVLRVEECEGVETCGSTQLRKFHHWYLSATCSEPVKINVYLFETTFPRLVKAVDQKLWEKIREEFEKASVQWQRPGEPDAIENRKRGIGVKRKGIEHKQAALPHKPLALTHKPQGKQLLLLPPDATEATHRICKWPGCGESVDVKSWACRRHWQLLNPQMQDFISQTYRPGQKPSDRYLEVEHLVFKWIIAYQKH